MERLIFENSQTVASGSFYTVVRYRTFARLRTVLVHCTNNIIVVYSEKIVILLSFLLLNHLAETSCLCVPNRGLYVWTLKNSMERPDRLWGRGAFSFPSRDPNNCVKHQSR